MSTYGQQIGDINTTDLNAAIQQLLDKYAVTQAHIAEFMAIQTSVGEMSLVRDALGSDVLTNVDRFVFPDGFPRTGALAIEAALNLSLVLSPTWSSYVLPDPSVGTVSGVVTTVTAVGKSTARAAGSITSTTTVAAASI